MHACVDAEQVEELVEDGRDAEVAEDQEPARDEHREHCNVDVAREYVAEEQGADLVRRVALRLCEVAADHLAHFEDVHEQQEHEDVRERERAVVLHDTEREVDVGGRRGLHEDLEARQQRTQARARRGRARAHDERDQEREHARAVDVQQALDGVGEDVEEDVDEVVLHADAVEQHGHEDEHAREANEPRDGAAGQGVVLAVDAGKLNLARELQGRDAEDNEHAPAEHVFEHSLLRDAVEEVQEHVGQGAAQEQDARVAVVHDSRVRRARERERDGRLEAVGHLRA